MNKQNAHLYTPLVQALAEGKTIEILTNRRGREDWEKTVDLDFSCAPDCYRIKPEPVMVPLGPRHPALHRSGEAERRRRLAQGRRRLH